MHKTKLLLSTAVGLAFAIAGPTVMAAGKKHPPQGNAKSRPAVNFAKAPFKQHKGQQPRSGHLKEKFLVETWAASTISLFGGFAVEDSPQVIKCKEACTVVTVNTAEFLSYYSYNQTGIC